MAAQEKGLTLIELLLAMALGGILLLGVNGLVGSVSEQWQYTQERQDLLSQANFVMARITQTVNATPRLLLPLKENLLTPYAESKRDLLALTLDPGLDRDGDGFADDDNDKDQLIDEDVPLDNTLDGAPGIVGIDDDHNGSVDDPDEGGVEEIIGGNPNPTHDNDGDGLVNEDWLDPILFRISTDGRHLLERMPNRNPSDGRDFSESIIAEAEQITFSAERLPLLPGHRQELLEITLILAGKYGGEVRLATRLRVGGGK